MQFGTFLSDLHTLIEQKGVSRLSVRINRVIIPRRLLFYLPIIFVIIFAYRTIKPAICEYASAELYQMTYQTANNILSDVLSTDGELFSFERNSSGEIVALNTHTRKINSIKTKTVSNLIAELRSEKNRVIELPLGSVTGAFFLSGHGPKLKLSILPVTRVDAEYWNEFSDAGINQTLYKLMLRMKIHTGILLGRKVVYEEIEFDLCLAETVLVGKTPQFFAGIE